MTSREVGFQNLRFVMHVDDGALDSAVSQPIQRVRAGVEALLDEGTYWVDWQIGSTAELEVWAPPVTRLGLRSTGDAMLRGPTGWEEAVDGTYPQGMPFRLYGKAAPVYER